MLDRETHIPLLVGAVLAVIVHLAAFTPVVYSRFEPPISTGDEDLFAQQSIVPALPEAGDAPEPDPDDGPAPKPREKRDENVERPDAKKPPRPETPLGDDNPDYRLTVAWISWDDFRELQAPKATTHQPAIQSQADPVEGAPPRIFDPTPPLPMPQPAPPRVSPAPVQQDVDPDPAAIVAQVLPQPMPPVDRAELQPPQPQPARKQVEAKADADNRGDPARQDEGEAEERRPAPPREQAVALGPENPLGLPDTQDEGRTDMPSDEGVPVEQKAASPPTPIGVVESDQGVLMTRDAVAIAPDITVDATGPELSNAPPVDQDQAQTLDPVTGEPTMQIESKGPDDPEGEAVTQDEAETPLPVEDAKPAKADERDGAKEGDDQPHNIDPREARQAARPARPAANAPQQQSRETSAPRDQAVVMLTDPNRDADEFQAGQVQVTRGIRITPVAPRWSLLDLYTTAPKNVKIRLVFNESGRVTEAKLLSSSGYASIDAKILASLYRWTAGGEAYEDEPKPFVKEGTLILRE